MGPAQGALLPYIGPGEPATLLGQTPAAHQQLDHIVVGGDLTRRGVTIQQYFGETHPAVPNTLAAAEMMTMAPDETFDVFLSHAHSDTEVVEKLGIRLNDEAGLKVWLDKWVLVPGKHWQQEIARGLDQARTCAICIGAHTPKGWFREEIERALNRQVRDNTFRVIPVILPEGDHNLIDNFLELRTWVDFKNGIRDPHAFYILVSGIRGIAPGRNPYTHSDTDTAFNLFHEKLVRLRNLRQEQLIDDIIAIEYQRKILDRYIEL